MARKPTLCHKVANLDFDIRLLQNGRDSFTVVYGKEIKSGLSYSQAALQYGASIMHALACDGQLDNREKGER
jgi:hypothetical protein